MTNSIPPIPKPITTQHTITTAFNLVTEVTVHNSLRPRQGSVTKNT